MITNSDIQELNKKLKEILEPFCVQEIDLETQKQIILNGFMKPVYDCMERNDMDKNMVHDKESDKLIKIQEFIGKVIGLAAKNDDQSILGIAIEIDKILKEKNQNMKSEHQKQVEDKSDSPEHYQKHWLNEFSKICHEANKQWWLDLETGKPKDRNIGELLMLVTSEIAEAMEGHRKNLKDDKLPHRDMLEVELVDALIRIFDMGGGLGLDLGGAFVEKMAFNKNRADHKVEHRLSDNGKKF